MSLTNHKKPQLGFGLGLRTEHYESIISDRPQIDWFEIITENYLVPGGKPHYYLEKIRENYPMVMHGVSMSIGSTDPLDWQYLRQVKALSKKIEAKWISDHLCWTGVGGKNTHDLLPLPYTENVINHVVERIQRIQDFLGQRILIENVSSYVTYHQSSMSEWEFVNAICERADCLFLFDINNIYVSAFNHGFDPLDYLNAIPKNRVCQIHLAGHTNNGEYIIDTHDHDIIDPVWDLYSQSIKRFGNISTLIERDDHIPPLSDLMSELNRARAISERFVEESVA